MVLRAAMLCAAVALCGCLRGSPPHRAATPTAVAMGFVHQKQASGWTTDVPAEFTARVTSELTARNLRARDVRLSADGTRAELTTARLASLTAGDPEKAPIVVLVETSSRYDSQIVGRYRWTVFAKITVADATSVERATSTSLDVPVTLEYDHQRDDAALVEAAGPIAKEVGVALDSYLASYGARPGAAGAQAPGAAPYQAIYFVMLDRFANGDATNDQQRGRDLDAADPQAWHGGDIRGLISRLDYIRDLGVTTIWMSPHFETRREKFGGHGAFHGYWVANIGSVDPGFGSASDLADLGREVSARGMQLYVDLVLNHVGPETDLSRERPGWFHRQGPIVDWNDPLEAQVGQVHGLPDLDQSVPEVYRYLLEGSLVWVNTYGAAGFRLDAVRHIGPEFWRRFLPELRAQSERPVSFLGEVFDGNPAAIRSAFALGFDQLFDFPLHYAAIEGFCRGGSLGGVAAALGVDRAYPDPGGLVTFADNHDLPRIASVCGQQPDLDRLFTFLLSVRGVPSITYGTEIGLRGVTEPQNRGDMRFGKLGATGVLLRERLAARRAHPALRGGRRQILVAERDALVWIQQSRNETAVIGISRKRAVIRVELPLGAKATDASLEGGFVACGERCLELAPGESAVAWLPGAAPLLGRTRRVELRATQLPAGDALLVGNVPELGIWDRQRALRGERVPASAGSGARFAIELPAGEALAFKLAVATGDDTAYESGANRILLVEDGDGPLTVELSWRK